MVVQKSEILSHLARFQLRKGYYYAQEQIIDVNYSLVHGKGLDKGESKRRDNDHTDATEDKHEL